MRQSRQDLDKDQIASRLDERNGLPVEPRVSFRCVFAESCPSASGPLPAIHQDPANGKKGDVAPTSIQRVDTGGWFGRSGRGDRGDDGILDRLARGNVVPVDPHTVGEPRGGIGRELGVIVADYHLGSP